MAAGWWISQPGEVPVGPLRQRAFVSQHASGRSPLPRETRSTRQPVNPSTWQVAELYASHTSHLYVDPTCLLLCVWGPGHSLFLCVFGLRPLLVAARPVVRGSVGRATEHTGSSLQLLHQGGR